MSQHKELIAELRSTLGELPSAGHVEVIQFEGSSVAVVTPELYDWLVTSVRQAADALEEAGHGVIYRPHDGPCEGPGACEACSRALGCCWRGENATPECMVNCPCPDPRDPGNRGRTHALLPPAPRANPPADKGVDLEAIAEEFELGEPWITSTAASAIVRKHINSQKDR